MNKLVTKAHRFIFFLYYKGVRFLMRYIIKLDKLDPRGRLAYMYLTGEGIEIGALHKPVSCDWKKVTVQYVDMKPIDELRSEYQELNPADFLPVDRIDNGETLATFSDESLDFVINSHMIEHTEDPIATLDNWLRVLRPGGILYLIVPDMRYNFDCQREPTTFAHLLKDHETGPETSLKEHYLEWADQVEGCRPEHIEDRARQLREQQYRIHFHVWTPTTFLTFLMACQTRDPKFAIIHMEQNDDEFIVLMQKNTDLVVQ